MTVPLTMLQDLTISDASAPSVLLMALFWISVAACVVAQFFIVRAVIRVVPAVTGSPEVPTPNRPMEIAWAVLPALLMAAVLVGAWRNLHAAAAVDPRPASAKTVPVAAVGRSAPASEPAGDAPGSDLRAVRGGSIRPAS